jgi:hypothetical protein
VKAGEGGGRAAGAHLDGEGEVYGVAEEDFDGAGEMGGFDCCHRFAEGVFVGFDRVYLSRG